MNIDLRLATISAFFAVLALAACGRGDQSAGPDDHGHDHAEASDHDESHAAGDDHGHDHGDGGHEHDAAGGGHEDHGDDGDHGHEHAGDGVEPWAVTAWGTHFEIFAEAPPLVVGEVSKSHTHVTILSDFSPLREGLVEAILRRTDGVETIFRQPKALRDGIFDVPIRPSAEAEYELIFRIRGAGLTEEIPAGRVRSGSPEDPGGLVSSVADPDGEVISFLKEQQWKTEFSTAWAVEDSIHSIAHGLGRVRPVAGGEVVLAAPMNAVVGANPWPHVGHRVTAGERMFALTPHVASDRSLAELEATETEKRAALEVAEERLKRLESLLAADAASPAEVEGVRAQVTVLRAQYEAARSDRRTARAGRGGSGAGETVPVVTPLSGQVAALHVTPGEVVSAGATLGRVVRIQPYWVEVYLQPSQALELNGESAGLNLRSADGTIVSIPPEDVRLVSRAPEVSPTNGTVACIFQVSGTAPFLGSAVEVEVALPETRPGIVIPASAIVDDGGVPVIFAQHDGEGFLRREVEVEAREGERVVVRGVQEGERVVTLGGSAIRRATLISSGASHGHVH